MEFQSPNWSELDSELTFLNLNDCSAEEKVEIFNILKSERPEHSAAGASTAQLPANKHDESLANPANELAMTQPQSMYEYSNEGPVVTAGLPPPPFNSYQQPASGIPHVYINQVTANVNVHHAPTQVQDDHHQQHRFQPGQLPQPGGIPMTHHGPPPPANLPPPMFGQMTSAYYQGQPTIGMVKGATQHDGMIYPSYPAYPSGYFINYGYPGIMSPQAHFVNRAHLPIMTRGQSAFTQAQAFFPPAHHIPAMSEMSQFPPPPPLPVTSAVAATEPVVVSQHQPQVEVQPSKMRIESVEHGDSSADVEVAVDEAEEVSFGFDIPEEVRLPDPGATASKKEPMIFETKREEQVVEEKVDAETDQPASVESETIEDEPISQPRAEESQQGPKSWASLFHKEPSSVSVRDSKPMAMIHPFTGDSNDKNGMSCAGKDVIKGIGGSLSLGSSDHEMASFFSNYALNHRAPSLKPRGLSNRSNWCFVNAVMQALAACPPFFNFMKNLPEDVMQTETMKQPNSPLKIMAAVNAFLNEFTPLENFPRMSHRKNKKSEDLPIGKTFEASSIFQVLLNLNSDTFKVIEGRQEDAEEFLTFLLNGLNDEILGVMKLSNTESDDEKSVNGFANIDEDEMDAEWKEVGPKNKSCVTRRGGDHGIKTPIADMFQGQIRSCVSRSAGETTATLQPFFTLQLDIQSDAIKSVADALAHNFTVESLDGYVCSHTKQEIEASRSLLLEELPPILVLHLKRFLYNETSGGCQKFLKNIDFPVDLEISKDILSPNSRNKYQARQRAYKLFAVVTHSGTEATKGHYVADIYHTGLSSWIHCDDSSVKALPESQVLAHSGNSMPYILFYRRGDTMGGGAEKSKSSASNKSAA